MDLFDREATFGDDYLYFYEASLDEARTQADVERILEALDLTPGSSILDAPCGHGRISNLLAEQGFDVTGVDATPGFIDLAREDAARRGVAVDYRVGDLRRLGVDGPFDAVVCWFTSFGYFDDAYNRAVLAEFARVLKPGGRLAIEAVHHDGFVRRFTPSPFAVPVFRGDDALIDSSIFDPVSGRVRTERVVYRDGEMRRTHHEVRVPTLPEYSEWLRAAGFSTVESDRALPHRPSTTCGSWWWPGDENGPSNAVESRSR